MNIAKIGFKWISLSNQTASSSEIKGYYEYLINGVPLSVLIDDSLGYTNFVANNFIGSIWKTGKPFDDINRNIFLGQCFLKFPLTDYADYESYFLNSEIPIYTCPCGEINCKGIIVKKKTLHDYNIIEWSFEENKSITSVYFDAKQYTEAINRIFDILTG